MDELDFELLSLDSNHHKIVPWCLRVGQFNSNLAINNITFLFAYQKQPLFSLILFKNYKYYFQFTINVNQDKIKLVEFFLTANHKIDRLIEI